MNAKQYTTSAKKQCKQKGNFLYFVYSSCKFYFNSHFIFSFSFIEGVAPMWGLLILIEVN